MREVKCHNIDGQSSRNLDDLHMTVFRYWYSVRSDGLSLESLQRLRDEILDYVAVQSLEDPTLSDPRTRAALRTAAEFDLGMLDLGCFPTGDFEIRFLLIDERISNFPPADGKVGSFPDDTELFGPARVIDPMPTTARTWLDTYAICLIPAWSGSGSARSARACAATTRRRSETVCRIRPWIPSPTRPSGRRWTPCACTSMK
jgi:hypothetical protein